MPRKKKIEQTDSPAIVNDLERAQISVPAPGLRFSVLNRDPQTDTDSIRVGLTRQKAAMVHYEMYRKHPTLRGAIEKIAKTAVATGYTFIPAEEWDSEAEIPVEKRRELTAFARRSRLRQLLRTSYKDLLIFGDAYWWIERARNGKPIRAKRLHPAFVEIKFDGAEITSYMYGDPTAGDKRKRYSPRNVVHYKLDDPGSDLYGLSLLTSLEATVASDLFAMSFNGKFFENAAQTGVIFALKSTDAGEIERNREYLKQEYVGTDNAHKPLLLEGDIDVKQSVAKMQEMQFIEGRKFNRQEILTVLDVPPEKVGISEDSNRSVGKEADHSFRSEAVAPLQTIVEDEFNDAVILDMFGWDDVLFHHNEVSQRDSLDQMKLLAEAERMGVLSPNYIRRVHFGLKGVEGGDQHFIQTAAGLIPLTWVDEVAQRLLSGPVQPDLSGVNPSQAARQAQQPEQPPTLDDEEDEEGNEED